MSIINRTISIQQKDGSIQDYNISFAESGDSSISVMLDGGVEKIFSDDDLFKSLKLIRAYFEKEGAKILCNGARVDVYPSGMSRGMGRGRNGYVLVMGKQALRDDLVDIFDYAEASLIGSIEVQEQYHKQWVKSLG